MVWRQMIRKALGLYPTLDLHGLGVRDAIEATRAFLLEARSENLDVVRIVYGKGHHSRGGRGVLRHAIPAWMDKEGRDLVDRFERRPDASGADGYVVVWLRKE